MVAANVTFGQWKTMAQIQSTSQRSSVRDVQLIPEATFMSKDFVFVGNFLRSCALGPRIGDLVPESTYPTSVIYR